MFTDLLCFSGRDDVASDVEVIAIQQVSGAYDRLLKSDVKYSFSTDLASLKAE